MNIYEREQEIRNIVVDQNNTANSESQKLQTLTAREMAPLATEEVDIEDTVLPVEDDVGGDDDDDDKVLDKTVFVLDEANKLEEVVSFNVLV